MLKARQEAYEIVRAAKEETEQILKEARKTRRQNESEATRTTEKVRLELNQKQERLKRQIEPPYARPKKAGQNVDPKQLHIGEEVRIISLGSRCLLCSHCLMQKEWSVCRREL